MKVVLGLGVTQRIFVKETGIVKREQIVVDYIIGVITNFKTLISYGVEETQSNFFLFGLKKFFLLCGQRSTFLIQIEQKFVSDR